MTTRIPTSAFETPAPYPWSRGVIGVWYRHALALARVWKVAITWFLIEPACVLLAMGLGVGQLVGTLPEHGDYARFVTPGLIIGVAMYHSIFESAWGAFQRIQASSMETWLTTPIRVSQLAAGEVLWGATRSAISTCAVGGLAMLFGWLDLASFPGVLCVAILVGIEFGALGLCFAAASQTLSTLSLIFTVVATPLFFFSGSFFPIEILPSALQPVAWLAPLSPGVQLARGLAERNLDLTHLGCLVYLVILCAALFPLAVRLLDRRLIR